MDDGDAQQVPEHAEREPSGRTRMRDPRMSCHMTGTMAIVAAAAREEDDLGVEDDAGRAQTPEDVLPDLAAEALEAALGIRHVAR